MQEPIVNVIEVDLPPTARVKYREMERELFTMIESSPVEAANAAVKVGQAASDVQRRGVAGGRQGLGGSAHREAGRA